MPPGGVSGWLAWSSPGGCRCGGGDVLWLCACGAFVALCGVAA